MKYILFVLILICSSCSDKELVKEYYDDGTLRAKYDVNKNGDLHGKFKGFNEDGVLILEEFYKNGKLHGQAHAYTDNGNLKWKGEFKNGIEHGEFRFFHENGELSAIGNYDRGKKQGIFKNFSEKSIPEVKVEYDDGNIHGEFWYFNEEGKIDKVKLFKDGDLVSIFRNYKPVEEIETLFWLEIVPMVDTLVTDEDLKVEFTITDIPDVDIRMGIMVFCDSVNLDRSDYIRLESYNKGEATYLFKPANFGVESNDRCEMIGFVNEEGGKEWQVTSKAVFYVLDNDATKIP